MSKERPLEDIFDKDLRDAGISGFERNVTFIPGRKFRADFWFEDLRLALEVDGGVFKRGPTGHTTGVGYHSDRVRDQLALASGIVTVRFTTPQIRNGEAVKYVAAYLPVRGREVSELSKLMFRGDLPSDYGLSTKNKRKK